MSTTPRELMRGDLVEHDGVLAAVVGVGGDPQVPEGHLALWFGDPRCRRISEGGSGRERPEVWTVPKEHVVAAVPADFRH